MELVLRGIPASQGLAIGMATWLCDDALLYGDARADPVVLVAPRASAVVRMLVVGADPSVDVCGIIVARGGALSSLASLARVLGVPAVFGAVDAVALVRQGELVLVDGGTGLVYRLGEAEESCDGTTCAFAQGKGD